MSDTWTPEPRPIPAELEDDYPAREYGRRTHFASLAERLDTATRQQLIELARGGLGEPDNT